ncbi:hypothetical protein FRC04_001321 [Tulasnella sp. 424]|nr:hypothetical protein FRC04_001321 [Tulasnella sp. 424]KAG8966781.1 hypothetical protein FRC05_002417 [Tulasnella sp. 425]
MAPRHSVSPAATPYQHGQSTTAQPYFGSAVPATPTGSTEHRSGNTVVSSEPQLAFASDSRRGHATSNITPRLFPTLPTSEYSVSKQSLDPQELLEHIVEVETEAFVRAVLYKDPQTMEEDECRAAQYLKLSQTPSPHEGRAGGYPTDSSLQQPTISPPTTSHPTESTPNRRPSTPGVPPHQKPLPRKLYVRENDMYAEHVELLNSVSRFFQANKKDVDEAWLPAQPPRHDIIPTASQNAGPPLNRVFQDTHNLSPSFSRYKYGQAGLRPDLCLLIESGGAPEESEGEPKESKPKPKVTAHWKDVLVPIELKSKQNMDASVLVEMAQYARSIMVEQYDRTFVITVLITGHMCRVFHWDVAGAQVTRAFNIHENAQLFLQVMGRLATMTPSELGYDTHFSNAGRVRSTETIETHLTIHLSKPRPFLNHAIPSPTPECPHKLVVKLEEMLFESTNGLFNRATRVWRAVPVNDPPSEAQRLWSKEDTYIVKQNWANDRRPNEGFFHTLTEDVEAVPQLVGMEEREFTCLFRTRFKPQEVLGVPRIIGGDGSGASDGASTGVGGADVSDEDSCSEDMSVDDEGSDDVGSDAASGSGGSLSAADVGDEEGLRDEEDLRDGEDVSDEDSDEEVRAEEDVVDQKVASKADTGNKEPLERVLLRFVFKGQGRPLSEATDSIELLQATAQWVTGLVELDDLGITHRDVSYGNLLLPLLQDKKRQASIIDLGLAHLQDPSKIVGLYPAEDHDQGTETVWANPRPHHHVTGTLPFVAIELLEKVDGSGEEATHALRHDLESVFWVLLYTCIKDQEGTGSYLSRVLRGMTSPDPYTVLTSKSHFLTRNLSLRRMEGNFKNLRGFLYQFSELCRRKEMRASDVRDLVSKELKKLKVSKELRRLKIKKMQKSRTPRGTKRRPEIPRARSSPCNEEEGSLIMPMIDSSGTPNSPATS